ncbi:unnamed protein product [Sphenostylis stenocarpa]|uniref:Uncharacterized protein n=1 Tax=Sphenostylis stenocarpa TaxID=92480 RepID=A0AA86RVC4_9FABA|nr:unnamed protein product [Sphenostylis stenocarpa]
MRKEVTKNSVVIFGAPLTVCAFLRHHGLRRGKSVGRRDDALGGLSPACTHFVQGNALGAL